MRGSNRARFRSRLSTRTAGIATRRITIKINAICKTGPWGANAQIVMTQAAIGAVPTNPTHQAWKKSRVATMIMSMPS